MKRWWEMTPHEVGEEWQKPLHQLGMPQVAYAWHLDADHSCWIREDAEEYGVARAAMVWCQEDGRWRGRTELFATAGEAKDFVDKSLVYDGWLIDDTAEKPDGE